MVKNNGEVYEGDWNENGLNGAGKVKYSNGDTFVGNFKEGKREGPGRMIIKANKDIVEAEWIGDLKENKGRIHSVNGRVRIVEWKNDKLVEHIAK